MPDDLADRPELHLLSICTGGGGLDLGVELAIPGARAVCMVEREAFAVAVLGEAMEQGLLAPAPVWSDARTFRGRPWRGAVDLLTAGYPCQPFSHAGRRRGTEDPRHLWPSVRRIGVQTGAWVWLLENVGGHLSLGFDIVWRELRRLGAEVEAGLFTAEEVGASHIRERLFILAVFDRRCPWIGGGLGGGPVADGLGAGLERCAGQPLREQCPPAERSGEDLADADGGGLGRRQWSRDHGAGIGEPEDVGVALGDAPGSRRCYGQNPGADRCDARPGAAEDWRRRAGDIEPERAGGGLGHPLGGGRDGRTQGAQRRPLGRDAAERPVGGGGDVPLFPPGPGDLAAWRGVLDVWPQAEPAVRGMADGLAGRVDRLRMLGNGVVPLEAAHALRTLATRLARRSAGAALLVRMMEGEP